MNKIIYWIATAVMCLVFLFSAQMYLFKYEMVTGFFKALGFPVWLIYPMAILKILAVVAILAKKSVFLKDLAYAGFLFNALLALSAHINAKDGGYLMSLIALIATIVSWFMDKKLFTKQISSN
jgi:hypothetical protein